MRRILALLISFCLVFEQAGFAQVAGQPGVPLYLSAVAPSADRFRPIHLRSLSIKQGSDDINVLLDKGDAAKVQPQEITDTAKKLMEYFQIGLRLPNSMFWVNLRPDAPGEIIDPYLEKTDLGRVLLEADLQLKKDLAKFTDPLTAEGKQYWDRLYARAEQLYGSGDIEIPTVTRPWIVPGEIILGESRDTAYVYKATLNVMLEQDYLKDSVRFSFDDERGREMNEYSSQLVRELIIPKLTRHVNASKQYAPLRQVYYSLILAQWFKARNSGQAGRYAQKIDTRDLTGLTSQKSWSKDTYFKAYQKSFNQGEYNRQENVFSYNGMAVRRYFSGGLAFNAIATGIAKTAAAATVIPAGIRSAAAVLPNIPALITADGKIDVQSEDEKNGGLPVNMDSSPAATPDDHAVSSARPQKDGGIVYTPKDYEPKSKTQDGGFGKKATPKFAPITSTMSFDGMEERARALGIFLPTVEFFLWNEKKQRQEKITIRPYRGPTSDNAGNIDFRDYGKSVPGAVSQDMFGIRNTAINNNKQGGLLLVAESEGGRIEAMAYLVLDNDPADMIFKQYSLENAVLAPSKVLALVGLAVQPENMAGARDRHFVGLGREMVKAAVLASSKSEALLEIGQAGHLLVPFVSAMETSKSDPSGFYENLGMKYLPKEGTKKENDWSKNYYFSPEQGLEFLSKTDSGDVFESKDTPVATKDGGNILQNVLGRRWQKDVIAAYRIGPGGEIETFVSVSSGVTVGGPLIVPPSIQEVLKEIKGGGAKPGIDAWLLRDDQPQRIRTEIVSSPDQGIIMLMAPGKAGAAPALIREIEEAAALRDQGDVNKNGHVELTDIIAAIEKYKIAKGGDVKNVVIYLDIDETLIMHENLYDLGYADIRNMMRTTDRRAVVAACEYFEELALRAGVIRLMPGARELLDYAKSTGIPVVVITNRESGLRAITEKILEQLGLRGKIAVLKLLGWGVPRKAAYIKWHMRKTGKTHAFFGDDTMANIMRVHGDVHSMVEVFNVAVNMPSAPLSQYEKELVELLSNPDRASDQVRAKIELLLIGALANISSMEPGEAKETAKAHLSRLVSDHQDKIRVADFGQPYFLDLFMQIVIPVEVSGFDGGRIEEITHDIRVNATAPGNKSIVITIDSRIMDILKAAEEYGFTIAFVGGTARRMIARGAPTNGVSDVDMAVLKGDAYKVRDFKRYCEKHLKVKVDIPNFAPGDAWDEPWINPSNIYGGVDDLQTVTISRLMVSRKKDGAWVVSDGTANGEYIQDAVDRKIRLLPALQKEVFDRRLNFEGLLRLARIIAEYPDWEIDPALRQAMKKIIIRPDSEIDLLNWMNEFFISQERKSFIRPVLTSFLKIFIHARSKDYAIGALRAIGPPSASLADLFGNIFDLEKAAEAMREAKETGIADEAAWFEKLRSTGAIKELGPDKTISAQRKKEQRHGDKWKTIDEKYSFRSGGELHVLTIETRRDCTYADEVIYRAFFSSQETRDRFISNVLQDSNIKKKIEAMAGTIDALDANLSTLKHDGAFMSTDAREKLTERIKTLKAKLENGKNDLAAMADGGLSEVFQRPLAGSVANFEQWAEEITRLYDNKLTEEELAKIAQELGLDARQAERIKKQTRRMARILVDFVKSLPDDEKYNVFMLRDGIFIETVAKLLNKKARGFYLSKTTFKAFTQMGVKADVVIPRIILNIKKAMGLGDDVKIPLERYAEFKQRFKEEVKEELTGNAALYAGAKMILQYLEQLGMPDMHSKGVRFIDTSMTGSFPLFMEALLGLPLQTMGLAATDYSSADSRMVHSTLSDKLGFLEEYLKANGSTVDPKLMVRSIESRDYPVRFSELNNEGMPLVIEEPEKKAAFLYQILMLKNEVLKLVENNEQIEKTTDLVGPIAIKEVIPHEGGARVLSERGEWLADVWVIPGPYDEARRATQWLVAIDTKLSFDSLKAQRAFVNNLIKAGLYVNAQRIAGTKTLDQKELHEQFSIGPVAFLETNNVIVVRVRGDDGKYAYKFSLAHEETDTVEFVDVPNTELDGLAEGVDQILKLLVNRPEGKAEIVYLRLKGKVDGKYPDTVVKILYETAAAARKRLQQPRQVDRQAPLIDADEQDGGKKEETAPGGIDMRALPITARPMDAAAGAADHVAPVVVDPAVLAQLQKQWSEIELSMRNGPMPYENIRKYIDVCKKQGAQPAIESVYVCIAELLRMEEERAVATPPELKEILISIG